MEYRAVLAPDDNGSWFVSVPDVPGAFSHGRTLAKARSNIREAVALALDVPEESVEIRPEIQLSEEVKQLVDAARSTRTQAEEATRRAAAATEQAVAALSTDRQRLSLRDAAEIVGVSFQRVQQLRTGRLRV